MAGRIQYPYEPYNNNHGYLPNGPLTRDAVPQLMPPHPGMLEEELEIQHHELHRLLGENRILVEDRIDLQQELGAAREEFRQMNIAITDIQKENEMYTRQLIEKGLKLEADVWATEPLKNGIVQHHDEVKTFNSINHDLYGQVQKLKKDLAKLHAENKPLPALREELEEIHKELVHARKLK